MCSMRLRPILSLALLAPLVTACGGAKTMSFFVTSVAIGDGGNLGGLAGADAHCQALASAAGSAKQEWRAYLSAAAENGAPAVNARDRIGAGPWINVKGVEIAANLADLHGAANHITGRTALDERGSLIGAGVHDILTGSNEDGTLADDDATCHNWTSTTGHAMVGHSNRVGSLGGEGAKSWNSAHLTDGCTVPELQKLGSGALLYCFAAK
jgi:hypothetical protein